MKNKLMVSLLSIVLFHSSCQKESVGLEQYTPPTQTAYYTMLQQTQTEFNAILMETKPKNLSIAAYKLAVVLGEKRLSEGQQTRILKATNALLDYATKFAAYKGLMLEDISTKIAFGGLYSPNDDINRKFHETSFILNKKTINRTSSAMGVPGAMGATSSLSAVDSGEVLDCALEALGIDAIYALSASGLTTWTGAAIAKAFSAAAKRALGPVGVAIAVVSFGICIAQEIND